MVRRPAETLHSAVALTDLPPSHLRRVVPQPRQNVDFKLGADQVEFIFKRPVAEGRAGQRDVNPVLADMGREIGALERVERTCAH